MDQKVKYPVLEVMFQVAPPSGMSSRWRFFKRQGPIILVLALMIMGLVGTLTYDGFNRRDLPILIGVFGAAILILGWIFWYRYQHKWLEGELTRKDGEYVLVFQNGYDQLAFFFTQFNTTEKGSDIWVKPTDIPDLRVIKVLKANAKTYFPGLLGGDHEGGEKAVDGTYYDNLVRGLTDLRKAIDGPQAFNTTGKFTLVQHAGDQDHKGPRRKQLVFFKNGEELGGLSLEYPSHLVWVTMPPDYVATHTFGLVDMVKPVAFLTISFIALKEPQEIDVNPNEKVGDHPANYFESEVEYGDFDTQFWDAPPGGKMLLKSWGISGGKSLFVFSIRHKPKMEKKKAFQKAFEELKEVMASVKGHEPGSREEGFEIVEMKI